MTIQVIRLKPNPRGKDRTWGATTPAQLGAEWVDIKNNGTGSVDLSGVELNHIAYPAGGGEGKWASVCILKCVLGPGQVLRVHSGEHRPVSVLHAEDQAGAHWHQFTGKDQYVWNNSQGDTAGLWLLNPGKWIDSASYDPHPPEGMVLVRSGQKLIPAVATASGW